ncbi:MAG: type IX secretion system outer membrane channel protein PorV [Chitinophagaceae bacterium]
MRKRILFFSVVSFSILLSQKLMAQSTLEEVVNPRTTAVPFLRIAADARAAGMGDIGIATAPDANSSFWNLAKTPFAKSKTGIGLTYAPWLKALGLSDVYLATLGFNSKLNDGQSAIGGSLRFFSLGNIQFTDFAGNNLSQFRPREMALDFGYARKLSDRLSLGVALRYINSNLATGTFGGVTYKAGNAIAGDISLYYDGTTEANGGGFAWGVTLTNLGSKIGYTNDNQNKDYIPANLGIGFQYTYPIDEANKISFATDINKLLVPAPPLSTNNTYDDSVALVEYRNSSVIASWGKSFSDGDGFMKSLQFSLGAEYTYNDQFFFRAGYFSESRTEGNRKYFSLGAGIRYNVMDFNFSYLVPSGSGTAGGISPLANTIRFGVSFNLDPEESK